MCVASDGGRAKRPWVELISVGVQRANEQASNWVVNPNMLYLLEKR